MDLEQLVVNAPLGLDEAAQRQNVTQAAIAFNELVPMIPLFERYGNNPALEGVRVQAWPPDSDPTHLQMFSAADVRRLLRDFEEPRLHFVAGRLVPLHARLFANDIVFAGRKPR